MTTTGGALVNYKATIKDHESVHRHTHVEALTL